MKRRSGAQGALSLLLVSCLLPALACSGGSPSPVNPDKPPTGGTTGKPDASTPSTGPGNKGSGGSGGNSVPAGSGGAGGASTPVKADAAAPVSDASAPRDTRPSGSNGGSSGGGGNQPPAAVSDAGSPTAGPAGPWARNVTIGTVEVTQGVFVKIGEGNNVIDPGMRNAPLIEGRPIFVRVYVAPSAGFAARRLRGVLTLEGGGMSRAVEEIKMVAGASDPEKLDSTINFLVPATDVRPGITLSAAIYEAGEAAGADPSPLPRFPQTGGADLAIKAGRMVLDVVAMPMTGPAGVLEDTPARRQKLENDLYDLYPVQKVNLRFREPLKVEARMTSSSAGFTALRNARTADNAKPWEYYHLLVGRTDTNFSFAGVASGAGASQNDGSRRVGITVVSQRVVDGNSNTMAHEIGHNHGRNHAPACGASGADMMFPYMAGNMGVNGFSMTTLTLKSKSSFKELMGYCRPRWISDYTWKMLEARVRVVSGFAAATPPGTNAVLERSLQAFTSPGERPEFGIVPGRLVEGARMTATRKARLHMADGRVIEVPAQVTTLSDDVTREIAVNLPPDEVTRAEVIIDGETLPIDVSALP